MTMIIENNWYDSIPEQGVLCWVQDSSSENNETDIIIEKTEQGFTSLTNARWDFAKPVTQDEVNLLIYSH